MTKAVKECVTRVWAALRSQDSLVEATKYPVKGDPHHYDREYKMMEDNELIISACPAASILWNLRETHPNMFVIQL